MCIENRVRRHSLSLTCSHTLTHIETKLQNQYHTYSTYIQARRVFREEMQICLTLAFLFITAFVFVPPPCRSVSHHTTRSFLSRPSLSCSIRLTFRHRRTNTPIARTRIPSSTAPPMATARITISEKGAGEKRWYLSASFAFFMNFSLTWTSSHLKRRPAVEPLQHSHGHRAGFSPGSWTSRCSWMSRHEAGWRRHLTRCLPRTPPSSGSDLHWEETASLGSKTP